MLSKKKKKGLHKNFLSDLQKKKKVFTKIFQAISTKKRFPKNLQALHKILTIQKIVLSSSRGQANFRGLEVSRPRPRTSKCVLEDVLEAKDVLEDSTSAKYSSKLVKDFRDKRLKKNSNSEVDCLPPHDDFISGIF